MALGPVELAITPAEVKLVKEAVERIDAKLQAGYPGPGEKFTLGAEYASSNEIEYPNPRLRRFIIGEYRKAGWKSVYYEDNCFVFED